MARLWKNETKGIGETGNLSQVVPFFSDFLPFPTNFTHFPYNSWNVFLAVSHNTPIPPIFPHFPPFPSIFPHFPQPLRQAG